MLSFPSHISQQRLQIQIYFNLLFFREEFYFLSKLFSSFAIQFWRSSRERRTGSSERISFAKISRLFISDSAASFALNPFHWIYSEILSDFVCLKKRKEKKDLCKGKTLKTNQRMKWRVDLLVYLQNTNAMSLSLFPPSQFQTSIQYY